MKLRDTRSLTQEAQESLRLRAVKAVLAGKTQAEAATLFGVSRVIMCGWMKAYRHGGQEALFKKKRGRRPGEQLRIQAEQAAQIVQLITDHCPDQLGLPFALWTREAVSALITQKLGIMLPVRAMGKYLKRWGFTPQKPVRRAYEQQAALVKDWLETRYPLIKERAAQEKAVIHWGDEAGFRSDHQTGTSYGLKGKTPVIGYTGKRFRTNMISTVTNHGMLRFMLFDEAFTTDIFLIFLKRLIHKAPSKVFLIMDNHKVHHARRVKEWVEEHKDGIELFFLPAYSPELNPDELLNQDVKSNAVGRKRARTLSELRQNLLTYLFGTQRSHSIVRAYFRKKEVSYAA